LLDHIAAQPNTTMTDSAGVSQYAHNGGSNYFSLSRLNFFYRNYRQRNIQASASAIATWAAANPAMFAGVSLSSETLFPANGVDESWFAVEEWKMWLQNTEIYGPGGDYFGTGRVPAFQDIQSFNQATGQTFSSWSDVKPPSTIVPGDPFGEEWERWRVMMIIHAVSDETLWIAQTGIDRTAIFAHQTPRQDDYGFADSVETETPANGAGGVTLYGWNPSDYGEIVNHLRGSGRNNWGNFELNPQTTNFTSSYINLVTLYNAGIKIICPNSWESDEAVKDQYALFDSPNFGDTFGNALNQFLTDFGDTPRLTQPPPWVPGQKIVDLYDEFTSATSFGPDNHLEASGSVGNVARKSVYSAVSGVITYTLQLPNVASGQRLNFWTSVGIKDGAGVGGETQFQASINGQNLFGPGFHLNQNYWVWKRWVPIMVDVTDWAGSEISLQLSTTGNDVWGWTIWGSPAIYQSGVGETAAGNGLNLARGASVSVSSQDGLGAGWDAVYLTDGNIDGGTDGRNGWSSVSHSTAAGSEWAVVDLGQSQSIGKVTLFARSDLVGFSGAGFPTAFQIQGSIDGSTWLTLVQLSDYPSPIAGEGQIFTFVSTTARYVRIITTELGGVGNELGYRIQMVEIEVFA
jgi:hypothetical protein